MTGDVAAAIRKATALAALIDSTQYEGERSNAIDAYFRICERHNLDTTTLEPLSASVRRGPTSSIMDAFHEANNQCGGALDYEQWLAEMLDVVLAERAAA